MGLNIKNERVCALARDVARRTGQTQTGAIESALEAYLQRILDDEAEKRAQRQREEEQRLQRTREIVAEFHAAPGSKRTVAELMDELYDPVTGLPR